MISFEEAMKHAKRNKVIISPKSKNPYECVYSELRVDPATVPDDWNLYHIRTDDYGRGDWCTIEERVLVNHGGSLLIKGRKIKFNNGKDYFDLQNNKRWGGYVWAS